MTDGATGAGTGTGIETTTEVDTEGMVERIETTVVSEVKTIRIDARAITTVHLGRPLALMSTAGSLVWTVLIARVTRRPTLDRTTTENGIPTSVPSPAVTTNARLAATRRGTGEDRTTDEALPTRTGTTRDGRRIEIDATRIAATRGTGIPIVRRRTTRAPLSSTTTLSHRRVTNLRVRALRLDGVTLPGRRHATRTTSIEAGHGPQTEGGTARARARALAPALDHLHARDLALPPAPKLALALEHHLRGTAPSLARSLARPILLHPARRQATTPSMRKATGLVGSLRRGRAMTVVSDRGLAAPTSARETARLRRRPLENDVSPPSGTPSRRLSPSSRRRRPLR